MILARSFNYLEALSVYLVIGRGDELQSCAHFLPILGIWGWVVSPFCSQVFAARFLKRLPKRLPYAGGGGIILDHHLHFLLPKPKLRQLLLVGLEGFRGFFGPDVDLSHIFRLDMANRLMIPAHLLHGPLELTFLES